MPKKDKSQKRISVSHLSASRIDVQLLVLDSCGRDALAPGLDEKPLADQDGQYLGAEVEEHNSAGHNAYSVHHTDRSGPSEKKNTATLSLGHILKISHT